MSDPTVVESTMIRRVADHVRRRGGDPKDLARRAGIAEALTESGSSPTLMPFAQAMRYYEVAAAALGDRALALSIALEVEPREYGLTGLIWQHHASLEGALQALVGAYNAFFPNSRVDLQQGDDSVTLRHRWFVDVPGLDVFRVELLAAVYRSSLKASAEDWTPVSVRFAREPHDLERFRACFRVEPSFDPGAEADEMTLPTAPLRRPNANANPVLLAELMRAAKVHEERRRQAGTALARSLELVGCTVDLASGVVVRGAERLPLTTKERVLLEYLARRRNEVVSHTDIERDVWGLGKTVISHAPAVAIRRLRQKIEPPGGKPVNLQTVFGEGWKLVVP